MWIILVLMSLQSKLKLHWCLYFYVADIFNMWRGRSILLTSWCPISEGPCFFLKAGQVFAGVKLEAIQPGRVPTPVACSWALTAAVPDWFSSPAPLMCTRTWLWRTGLTPTWTCSNAASCCCGGTGRLWSSDATRTPGLSATWQPWGGWGSLWPAGGAVVAQSSMTLGTLIWHFSPLRRRTTGRGTWRSSLRLWGRLDRDWTSRPPTDSTFYSTDTTRSQVLREETRGLISDFNILLFVMIYVFIYRNCIQTEQEVVIPSLHPASLCWSLSARHRAPPLLPRYPQQCHAQRPLTCRQPAGPRPHAAVGGAAGCTGAPVQCRYWTPLY